MARNSPKPSSATIADQQAKALQLKLDGLTVREIAETMKLPSSTVGDRLTAAMTELVAPIADEVRLLELARLDRWHRLLEKRITDGEAAERIVPQLLRCQERRARYLGLDAPERVEQTTTLLPTADPAVEALLAEGRTAVGG